MKKLALLAIVALLFVACSKDQRQSKKLDGTWTLVSYNGVKAPADETETVSFTKDKKGEGTGTFMYKDDSETFSFNFDYAVEGDKLTISISENGQTFSESSTIANLTKTDLQIVSQDGDISIYEK